MASFVLFQIEVIWIFLKKGVYKLTFEGFILSNCFELNFNLLKPTKMEPLEVLVVLEVSKYGFHILWSLAAIFQTFIREQLFTFPFLDFFQTVVYLHNPFRPASVTPAS